MTVQLIKKRADSSAIQNANKVTQDLVQSAGSLAPAVSVMTELSARNQLLMDEA